MRDFDVVLSMDWLSRHRATLDCYKKEVKLHRLGKLEVKFRPWPGWGRFRGPVCDCLESVL